MNNYTILEMPICAVEVMSQRAQITRKCLLTPAEVQGKNFLIKNLSPLLSDTSLRVDITGDALITAVFVKTAKNEEKSAANFELTRLELKEAEISKALEWHQNQIKELEELEFALPDEAYGAENRFLVPNPVEKWQEFLSCRAALVEQHINELEKLKTRKEALLEEKKALLNKTQTKDLSYNFKEIYITLDREPAINTEITVTYQVLGAVWHPLYELRLNSGEKKATLSIKAAIAQMSGEEWPAVPITLSSSDVTRIASLPKLPSWRIGRPAPEAENWRPLPADSASLLTDYRNFVKASKKGPESSRKSRDEMMLERSAMSVDRNPAPMMAAGAMAAPPVPKPGFFSGMMMGAAAMASAPRKMARKAVADSAPCEMICDEDVVCEEAACVESFAAETPEEFAAGTAGGGTPGSAFLDYSLLQMGGADEKNGGELRPKAGEKAESSSGVHSWLKSQNPVTPSYLVNYSGYSAVPIVSDGLFHKVPLMSINVPFSIEYWAVPREGEELYRSGRFTSSGDFHLLSGTIEIYWDNQMLLSTTLPATASGETVSLPLGIEERCSICRTVQHNERQSGLISQSVTYTDNVTIELISRMPEPIEIHLLDRMPVTTSSDIKIDLQSVEPKVADFLDLKGQKLSSGVLGWLITCQPGQKQEVSFAYSIEIPAKQEVIGGGRRA